MHLSKSVEISAALYMNSGKLSNNFKRRVMYREVHSFIAVARFVVKRKWLVVAASGVIRRTDP